jgi:hypothetical protein
MPQFLDGDPKSPAGLIYWAAGLNKKIRSICDFIFGYKYDIK